VSATRRSESFSTLRFRAANHSAAPSRRCTT
jgi:hypothetical protein